MMVVSMQGYVKRITNIKYNAKIFIYGFRKRDANTQKKETERERAKELATTHLFIVDKKENDN